MQPTNSIVQKKKSFSEIINQTNYRQMIERSVGSPSRAAALISTLISVVNTNPALKDCDPSSIVSAALKGEIGMGLSVALGEYAIIPYGKTAQFQLQVNGLKRIAVRSGSYAKIGFYDVREGEYKGRDRVTWEPIVERIEDEDEREALPIIGYYGFYVLSGDYNGFTQTIYWSHEQILKHADRYSKAFDLAKYKKILSGKFDKDFTEADAKRLQQPGGGSPWYANPNELPHIKMCLKTIAKQLLGDGLAPKEVMQVLEEDNLSERTGEPVYYANDAMKPVEPVADEPEADLPIVDAEIVEPEKPKETQEKPKRGRKPAQAPVVDVEPEPAPVPVADAAAEDEEYDPLASFFG